MQPLRMNIVYWWRNKIVGLEDLYIGIIGDKIPVVLEVCQPVGVDKNPSTAAIGFGVGERYTHFHCIALISCLKISMSSSLSKCIPKTKISL